MIDAKGGRDGLCEWAAATFPDAPQIQKLATTPPSHMESWVGMKMVYKRKWRPGLS